MTTRTALCGCGRAGITVENDPAWVVACHCDFCQKRTGSAFAVGAYFAQDQCIEILGETKVYNGLEVDGVGTTGGTAISYHFCTTCGSTVYWTVAGSPSPATLGIAVGGFVDPGFPPPSMEFHVARRHHWVPPVPSAAQFEAFPT